MRVEAHIHVVVRGRAQGVGYLDGAQWQMGVHRRRGHAVAEKEVKRETRLGVTDPSGHA